MESEPFRGLAHQPDFRRRSSKLRGNFSRRSGHEAATIGISAQKLRGGMGKAVLSITRRTRRASKSIGSTTAESAATSIPGRSRFRWQAVTS